MTEPYVQHDRSANSLRRATRYLYLARHGDAGGEGNAALTVIRYAPGRPASVLLSNDMAAHLPSELKWTGFPPEFAELRV
ncbi:hypothetical protein ACFYOD_22205 [Streptomyces sp. NPDC006703]|uniref:hypothetical protein n=1 Tax=Streptomyces sp. NPDC006703 TaxID=3364759 RepID=UPI0036CF65C7